MGNLHAMIIHHVSQMVRWVTVRLQQNRIIIDSVNQVQFAVVGPILTRLAVHQIIEHGVSLHLQSNRMRLALGGSVLRLLRRDISAFSIVSWRKPRLTAVAGERVESLRRAEAPVGMAIGDEIVGVGSIEGGSLGLKDTY